MAKRPKPAPNRNPQFMVTATSATGVVSAAGNANVDYVRPELTRMLPKYELISDCLAGSDVIKSKGSRYLPRPNAADTSPENQWRYDAYKTRAVFYNVSERTLAGMVGQVFNAAPQVNVPDLLEPIIKDAGGDGVTLVQQAQACEETVVSKGRAGLLVDYPKTEGAVTRQAQLDGSIKPVILLYQPENIINWRTATIGSHTMLTLVVLREQYEISDDGFAVELGTQYRVLRLVDGLYEQSIWRGNSGAFAPVAELGSQPRDAKGNRLDEIPFTFIGASDNSPSIDTPPMYAICDLNIAHYRNSADYEESVFLTGQATPVLSGLDERWVTEMIGGVVELGSRTAIALPVGATASLLQMGERSAAHEAMEHKEKQMVALGAKLVETQRVQRTATEANQDEAAETSVLTTITDNVSAAYTWALEWAAIFQGVLTIEVDANTPADSPNAIIFKLNTDFTIATITPDQVARVIEAWLKEAITFSEMRVVLKKAAWASQDDKAAQAEIQEARMNNGDMGENEAQFGEV